MTQIRIPSREQCYELIREMEMLDHIVAHSIRVCQVAVLILDGLAGQNIRLNRSLIRASALLHDITKTRSFKSRENHAQTGDALLNARGYPEVGEIIGQHVCLEAYEIDGPITEAEVVNYADKRVLNDRVVSLDERMRYIRDRYAKTERMVEKLHWLWERSRELERKLFEQTNHSPEDLSREIDDSAFNAELACYRSTSKTIPTPIDRTHRPPTGIKRASS